MLITTIKAAFSQLKLQNKEYSSLYFEYSCNLFWREEKIIFAYPHSGLKEGINGVSMMLIA